MKREWEPGDVALACGPERDFLVVRTFAGPTCGDYWSAPEGWPEGVDPGDLNFLPLVVIDPSDVTQVRRLWDARNAALNADPMADSAEILSRALTTLIEPPKPKVEEPGTWGVVEASCCHSDKRQQWIHHPDGNWWPAFDYSKVPERTPLPDDWSDLRDPVVIREGIQ